MSYADRNENITREWTRGKSIRVISDDYGLSSTRIRQITRKMFLKAHVRPYRIVCHYVEQHPQGQKRCPYCMSIVHENDEPLRQQLKRDIIELYARVRCLECGEPSIYPDDAFFAHYKTHFKAAFRRRFPLFKYYADHVDYASTEEG